MRYAQHSHKIRVFGGKMQGFSYDLADERRNNTIFAAENVNVPDARLIPN
jgi:hypothetical protein